MPASYHHGDLRRVLLNEALGVLTSEGVGALSLRDLARRAGVSATAPYHHFGSKADLVCALAEDALAALDDALAAAAEAHPAPAERLGALGVAYVLFAVDHPERFRLAFRPEMGGPFAHLGGEGAALPAETVGFRHLVQAVRDLVPDPARQTERTLGAWSLAHGLASLLVDGPLRPLASDRGRVLALAQAVMASPEGC